MLVKNDRFKWKKYFILKAIPPGTIPDVFSDRIEKNEVYLGANVKLSSPAEMAYIKSKSLAEQFKEACRGRLKKRYGCELDLHIVECSSRENNTIENRIEMDSYKIKKRLTTGNFTSNKPV
jgi:hypothetical protein